MNYKKIFKNRTLRVKILEALSWIPDTWMVKLQYRIHVGRKLKLKSPTRFTEKMQYYKLRYRDKRLWRCVDKYEVRRYLEERGLGYCLNNLYGVYDRVEDIDFDSLPNEFVVKATSGGGSNYVYICRKNDSANQRAIVEKFKGLGGHRPQKPIAREWAYQNMPPTRLVVEEFIQNEDNPDESLTDYKFYCFNGKPTYCQVIGTRSTNETIDFFDMEWRHQPFYGLNPACGPASKPIPQPQAWKSMVELAKKLAEDFPFVRVDLYNVKGKIYFGELTFYPASGYGKFTPDEYDQILGDMFNINTPPLCNVLNNSALGFCGVMEAQCA